MCDGKCTDDTIYRGAPENSQRPEAHRVSAVDTLTFTITDGVFAALQLKEQAKGTTQKHRLILFTLLHHKAKGARKEKGTILLTIINTMYDYFVLRHVPFVRLVLLLVLLLNISIVNSEYEVPMKKAMPPKMDPIP